MEASNVEQVAKPNLGKQRKLGFVVSIILWSKPNEFSIDETFDKKKGERKPLKEVREFLPSLPSYTLGQCQVARMNLMCLSC